MELIEELKKLENTYKKEESLLITKNNSSVLLINISNDTLSNSYIRAITRYVSANTLSSYIVNTKDSVEIPVEYLNEKISELLSSKDIKLIIELTSTKEEYDIVYKTSKELDYTIVKELEDAFYESNITNIKQQAEKESIKNYDYIEVAINDLYHDIDKPENIERVCNALKNFIKMYINFTD